MPPATQTFISRTKAVWGIGTGSSAEPGFQPQPTSGSPSICSMRASGDRLPLSAGSLSIRHSSAVDNPCHSIEIGAAPSAMLQASWKSHCCPSHQECLSRLVSL
jgi:hypothetical protein